MTVTLNACNIASRHILPLSSLQLELARMNHSIDSSIALHTFGGDMEVTLASLRTDKNKHKRIVDAGVLRSICVHSSTLVV